METEDEQLAELKRWWAENGRSLIVGLVIGLGGVFGWTSWQTYLKSQAELASLRYEQILNDASAGIHTRVRTQTEAFIAEFPDNGYAALAALLAARSALAEGDLAAANVQLDWVVEHATSPELKDIARLRRARVRLGEDRLDEALRELDTISATTLSGPAAELRGDVLVVKGDENGARDAYENALAADSLSAAATRRVQMKLSELGQFNYPPGSGPKTPAPVPGS